MRIPVATAPPPGEAVAVTLSNIAEAFNQPIAAARAIQAAFEAATSVGRAFRTVEAETTRSIRTAAVVADEAMRGFRAAAEATEQVARAVRGATIVLDESTRMALETVQHWHRVAGITPELRRLIALRAEHRRLQQERLKWSWRSRVLPRRSPRASRRHHAARRTSLARAPGGSDDAGGGEPPRHRRPVPAGLAHLVLAGGAL